MKKIKSVFWDFHGVWSKEFFYKSISKENPEVGEFIQKNIFRPTGIERGNKWMRGDLTMNDINEFIAKEMNIDLATLTEKFLADVRQMEIETRHIPIVRRLKQQGIKVGMITDNMEVLDTITRPRLKLDELFDGVFNSFSQKMLKSEGLFEVALQNLGVEFSTALMIDDSMAARKEFERLGGQTYAYTNFEEFANWAEENLPGMKES